MRFGKTSTGSGSLLTVASRRASFTTCGIDWLLPGYRSRMRFPTRNEPRKLFLLLSIR